MRIKPIEEIKLSVDEHGNVYGSRGTLMSLAKLPQGYLGVSGYDDNGKRHPFLVHRLIAQAFLGPCPKGQEVNHKNGIKTDNRISNLEYCTRSENQLHALSIGLYEPAKGEDSGNVKLTEQQVLEMRRELANNKYSLDEAAKKYGVTKVTICQIRNGDRWKHLPTFQPPSRKSKRLTPDKVREIRQLLAGGIAGNMVAEIVGTNEATVSLIKNNKVWTSVPIDEE